MLGYLSPTYTSACRLDLQLGNISRDDIFTLMLLNVAKEVERNSLEIISHVDDQISGGVKSEISFFFDETSEITIQATGIEMKLTPGQVPDCGKETETKRGGGEGG